MVHFPSNKISGDVMEDIRQWILKKKESAILDRTAKKLKNVTVTFGEHNDTGMYSEEYYFVNQMADDV